MFYFDLTVWNLQKCFTKYLFIIYLTQGISVSFSLLLKFYINIRGNKKNIQRWNEKSILFMLNWYKKLIHLDITKSFFYLYRNRKRLRISNKGRKQKQREKKKRKKRRGRVPMRHVRVRGNGPRAVSAPPAPLCAHAPSAYLLHITYHEHTYIYLSHTLISSISEYWRHVIPSPPKHTPNYNWSTFPETIHIPPVTKHSVSKQISRLIKFPVIATRG